MKRLTSLLLSIVMAVSVISFGGLEIGGIETHAAEKVVFVKEGGSGDGSSVDAPLGTLEAAYAALGDAGGRVVLCGHYTMKAPFEEPVHNGQITVTQNYNDKDYREAGSLYTGGTGRRYILNGPTVFENIKFTTQNKGGLFFICQYNRIEFAEGILCEGFDGSLVANAVTLLGGEQLGLAPKKKNDTGSHIVVKSGSDILIAGLCRQMKADNDRSAKIEVYGGEITTLYGGNINGCKGKSAEIKIDGGEFTGKVACEYGLSDSVKVSVNGGDFSACKLITGTAINSEITVADKVEAVVTPLLSGFKTVTTSKGVVVNKIPEEVFGADNFTASDGTVLPYRYYYPEGYDGSSDKYPIFVYFHGNGSRGSDNKAQLGATHAIVSKMLNSGTDMVIIAPQAPKESAWILSGTYPGGTSHDPAKAPTSKHFSAAIELVNKVMEDPRIDRDRLYISGGSNGAGACWSFISRNPRSVAAAVILAGTGSTGGAEKVAPTLLYTPIWTFHGDSDKTLNVAGTRQIVTAVEELGGKDMLYTEMAGRDHDIWVDAANYKGLIDWVLSQKRTDAVFPISKVLDTSLIEENYVPAETTPADTDGAENTTAPADSSAVNGTAADTSADTSGVHSDETKANIALPIGIGAGVLALIAITVVIILKKKKK